MNPTLMDRLPKRLGALLDLRVLRLALPALLLLLALECWLLVLRAPVAQWRALQAAEAGLETTAEPIKAADVQGLRDEIARLRQAAHASAAAQKSAQETVVNLIGVLGPLAARHGVALGDVAAGSQRALDGALQIDYDLRVRGRYLELAAWLAEAGDAVAPLAVTGLNLRGAEPAGMAEMNLRLSDFVATAAAEGSAP